MCLYVETVHHDSRLDGGGYDGWSRRYFPRIAKQDILIFKILANPTSIDGVSPYQDYVWTFGKQVAVGMDAFSTGSVDVGLHAYINVGSARKRANRIKRRPRDDAATVVVRPGVIPKGSRLFFGHNGEIVADKMIVYKNLAQLRKARGQIGPGIKKREISTQVKVK